MNPEKIGTLIARLRREKGWTQMQLAEALHLSDRTVSKWERGAGLPDISLLGDVADVFNINVETLLSGEYKVSDSEGGNMKKARYFVCPTCGAFSVATGEAEVSCCGQKLAVLEAGKALPEERLQVEELEGEWFVTADHPMSKDHYISFVALATGAKVTLVKLYPEWDFEVRLPRCKHGLLLWYCTQHGLFYQNV